MSATDDAAKDTICKACSGMHAMRPFPREGDLPLDERREALL